MEDVAFMRSNNATVQESYMFLVSSKNRDRLAYPHASEYTVEFNSPFRNVCSFSLLDATIPRTHYSIDEGTNTLLYSLEGDPEILTATVPPGDYNLLQLTDALNQLLLGGLQIDPYTNPYELSNKARFYRPSKNFTLFMASSGLRTALGFGESTYSGTSSTSDLSAYTGPLQESLTTPLSSTRYVRQTFVSGASGAVSMLSIACNPPTASLSLRITATIKNSSQEIIATGIITPSRSPTAIFQGTPGSLEADSTYTLILTANEATEVYVASGTSGESTYQVSSNSGSTWTNGTSGMQLCMDLSVTSATPLYQTVSPHLVDITGEKLVFVRVPEIEQAMFRERYTEQNIHVGLGYCKLGGLGFRENRTDYFTAFPARVFHPLSKVSKITVRLETPGGELYNTRGVDHFLLFNITYYKVSGDPIKQTTTSILNPSYNPDVHAFLQQKWQREADLLRKRPPSGSSERR